KFGTVLLLAIVLGGLMPCLLEAIGVSFGVPTGVSEAHFKFSVPDVLFSFARGSVALAAALAVISFFSSALTRNTLHALGTSIVFTGVFFILLNFAGNQYQGYGSSLWTGPLIFVIGITVAVGALLYLSWSNYKLLQIRGTVWLRTLLILGASLFLAG